MLFLSINGDYFKLHDDIKSQEKLKRELLSRYKDSDIVVFEDNGFEIDRCTIEDLYNTSKDSGIKYSTPYERIKGLTLPR